MRTGEPELVRDAERFGLRSMLCVPLVAGARTLGTITLLSSEHRYGAAELELASEIARRTAAAIEIERSEERYRMLFEASPMPMWVYDADTLVVRARQRRRDPQVRLLARGVPEDADHRHPPARGHPGDARGRQGARRAGLAGAEDLAPPAARTAR